MFDTYAAAKDRILVAEAWVTPLERMAHYVRPDEMHQAFNFGFLLARWRAPTLRDMIVESLAAMDEVGAPATWVLSNHDVARHASRLALPDYFPLQSGIGADDPQPDRELGLRRARAATLLMLGLPGSAYLYQGEELGLPEHTTLADHLRQDPTWRRSHHTVRGRDGCRVPLPWQADAPAFGFSPTGRSWLPQPDDWRELAADRQVADPGSTLGMYRVALRLRRERRLGTGKLTMLDHGEDVVAASNGDTLIVTNLGVEPVPLPSDATVLLASAPLADPRAVPTDVTVWAALGD
jgi:alpha-glucosidase